MNLKKSQPEPADAVVADVESHGPNKVLLIGGGVVAVAAAGALAFVLLSGGDDPVAGAAPLPRPSASATPSATEAATPSTSVSIPTYAAKNARDPFKALVVENKGGGSTAGSSGGSGSGPTTAPIPGGSGGGAIITLPGRTVTVTQTVAPTTSTTAPTGLPTTTATQTPIPTGTAPVIEVPHGTQLLAIKEIAKDADGNPTSVTMLVDGKEYAGLTPQRDVDPAKWKTFGTYFTLLNLTDTTATIRYGDGQIYDVTVGFYTIVTS
jgi:hypothetical protein